MRKILFLCLLFIAGCQNYDVTINDTQVYGPKRLFTDFDVDDPALRECLQQQIADQRISGPLELEILNCSSAGIQSLQGLGLFAALKQVKFSDNGIRNLVEMGQLAQLEVVVLDNNDIVDPVPLDQLSELRVLELSGNAKLQCPRQDRFAAVAQLTLPEHCPARDT